jgi:hypothetical protein
MEAARAMTERSIGGPLIVDPERYGHCVFTREQADGAIPNGTMVRKIDGERGDSTPYGTIGEVIGSIAHELPLPDDQLAQLPRRYRDTRFAYFIEWAERPSEVLAILDKKIEEA